VFTGFMSVDCRRMSELKAVGVAGVASLIVLAVVGRKSYQRKIVQLTKELEKQGKGPSSLPPKIWAVLTPGETIKVFIFPLAIVGSGTIATGYGLKRAYGIRDMDHGMQMIRWIARTGPKPTDTSVS